MSTTRKTFHHDALAVFMWLLIVSQCHAFFSFLPPGRGVCPACIVRTRRPFFVDATNVDDSETDSKIAVDVLDPTEIGQLENLVQQRSQARWEGNYTHADMIRLEIQNLPLPHGYQVLVKDIPRKEGGGSTWKLVQKQPLQQQTTTIEGPTVLQLAHAALGLAVGYSIQLNIQRSPERSSKNKNMNSLDSNDRQQKLDFIVQQAKHRMADPTAVQHELSGRKAADAAFWFAIAGVSDRELFQHLIAIATRELQRFGSRSSCRLKDVLQILERFAAAGAPMDSNSQRLAEVAESVLLQKSQAGGQEDECRDPPLDLHSSRSLLLIWKFSTKQKKQKAFLRSAHRHWESLTENSETQQDTIHHQAIPSTSKYDWNSIFEDSSRPLVIDIGCGMGVSLLGLARSDEKEGTYSSDILLGKGTRWCHCNFAGVDLGALGIGYANGISTRLGLKDRLHFFVDSAEDFVEIVRATYPGPIVLSLIQFPTPFRLKKGYERGGNMQLPSSARDGFMVSQDLLVSVKSALSKERGRVLIQSNCEDVAVWMRNLAITTCGFDIVTISNDLLQLDRTPRNVKPRQPQRTLDWLEMGGERAFGPGWLPAPVLHREARTETEVACGVNGTPVHRCLLTPSSS